MTHRICRRLGWLFTLVALALGFLSPGVAAADSGSLTLVCQVEDVVLSDSAWRIYLVGQRNSEDTFTLTGDFAEDPVSLEDLTDRRLQDAANTLENYASTQNRKPTATGKTDAKGSLTFTGLAPGLYLVSGERHSVGTKTYIPSPTLVELGGAATLDYTVHPKYRVDDTLSGQIVRFTVQKVWQNDESQPEARATELEVALYQDGELFEEITLSAENDWSYTWEGLRDAQWRVEELAVPDGYTVVYRQNEQQYLIVNTYAETPPVTTATPVTPPPGGGSGSGSISTGGKLPQTGLLWWPVPVLLAGGTVCLMVGWRLRKRAS